MHNLIAEKALGKRIVSFGESGGFVKGKSEFPLRKVQGPERAENRGIGAEMAVQKLHYIDIILPYGFYEN